LTLLLSICVLLLLLLCVLNISRFPPPSSPEQLTNLLQLLIMFTCVPALYSPCSVQPLVCLHLLYM